MTKFRPVLIFLCFLLISSQLNGSKNDEHTSAKEPTIVTVGAYLLDIYELDLKEESFMADFYIWMTWPAKENEIPGESISPNATKNGEAIILPHSRFDNFEFINGELEDKSSEQGRIVDAIAWRSFRCRVKFRTPFDFKAYPLDTQILKMVIEDADNDIDQLRYTFSDNMKSTPELISMSGWEPAGPVSYSVTDFIYETNYGNPSREKDEKAVYSRMTIKIPIRHVASYWTYMKLFIPVFIAVLIAMLAFLMEPTDLDPRFGVGIAAVFATVTSLVVSNATAPETPYFSLIDKIHLISLGFIFVTILWSCVSLRLFRVWCKVKTTQIDRIIGMVVMVAYIATMIIVTINS